MGSTMSSIENNQVGGIVLCGGGSRRMGQPKHSLRFGADTMLTRIIGILSERVSPVLVVAAEGQSLPELASSVIVVRDRLSDAGPLAGLSCGLAALAPLVSAAYATSCDVPLLRPEFVQAMIDSLGDHDLVIASQHDRLHPLAAVYRTTLAPLADELLAAGQRRPISLLDHCRARKLDVEELRASDPGLDSLRNINTPEDYETLLAEFLGQGEELPEQEAPG